MGWTHLRRQTNEWKRNFSMIFSGDEYNVVSLLKLLERKQHFTFQVIVGNIVISWHCSVRLGSSTFLWQIFNVYFLALRNFFYIFNCDSMRVTYGTYLCFKERTVENRWKRRWKMEEPKRKSLWILNKILNWKNAWSHTLHFTPHRISKFITRLS